MQKKLSAKQLEYHQKVMQIWQKNLSIKKLSTVVDYHIDNCGPQVMH